MIKKIVNLIIAVIVKRSIIHYCASITLSLCLHHFCLHLQHSSLLQRTTVRLDSYSVSLPKVKESDVLANSYECALKCFKGVAKKLSKRLKIKIQYIAFINEYKELDYMS
uniref:Uncharacterized protein n=1 Tax=Glossina morsitans morsitans TaxID=37546 RepID=A0ABK9NGL1_GLOMM